MYAGVSMTHLTEPVFTTDAGGEGDLYKRTAYFTAGYYYTMPNGLIQLRPSVFVKSDFVASQMSFNLTALYNQMFWGGITYRGSNDIGIMVGATLKSNISFGIAYDYHLSSELNSPGSIDVMLKYCFSMSKKGGKTSYRSVRFL
jgi:type IX secretion system PorP/SprF family membrane protein